jgi:hypothetical protein
MSAASSEEMSKGLEELSALFKKNVVVKDRSYHLTTYKQCFVGSEAVDFLVKSGMAESREDAVLLGKALASDFHLFEHVTRDHEFKDEALFYRFVAANERGAFSVNEGTGKTIAWSDFLAPVNASGEGSNNLLPKIQLPDFEAISPKDAHAVSQVWPLDEYNTHLLNNVHPPLWQDPPADTQDGSSTYDVVVIGAGAGGLVSAAGAAGCGARVAIIEEHLLGGDW